jgi:Family of unknown function (DUF5678)
MDEALFERETAANRAAYEGLRERVKREYAGQYVALAHGAIVATAPTFDETMAAVQRLAPVPDYYLVFPADEVPCFEPFLSY